MSESRPALWLSIGFAVVVILGYPIAVGEALGHWEPRTIAWIALGFMAITTAVRSVFSPPTLRGFLIQYGAGIALLLAVIATNERLGLLLVPALVNGLLAIGTGWTLTTEQSLVERVATVIEPYLPDFTRSYCRKVTLLWTLFFAANAVGIAVLAVAATEATWRFYTAQLYFAIITAFSIVEFLVRKIFFRNYSNRPVDRVFASVFPAKNTEQGRRSEAYLQKMRELGLKTD